MEITFIREDNINYMKINGTGQENRAAYIIKMLSCNDIPGILIMQERIVDSCLEYYYDIKSYKSVMTLYETHDMTVNEAVKILQCLDKSIAELDKYFLERDGILLNPRCIMLEAEEKKAYFAYVPGKNEVFEQELRRLLEFMLEHMEHSDRNKTIRFYEMYQNVIRGESDIQKIIEGLADDSILQDAQSDVYAAVNETEYVIPGVMNEHIEQETEIETVNPKKAAVIIKAAAVFLMLAALLSQIFPDAAPVNIPVFAAAAVLICAAAAYLGAVRMSVYVAAFFTKTVTEEQEIPYSFLQSEYAGYNSINENSIMTESEKETKPKRAAESENATTLLSEAVKRKCIIELIGKNDGVNASIYIESVPCILGCSAAAADVVIEQPFISRMHARIGMENDGTYFIQDMFSTNGTFVNEIRLAPEMHQPIKDGDTISLAASSYKVDIQNSRFL